MKAYKITEFDKTQSRVFVEVTHDDDSIQVYHLPVSYEYLERYYEKDSSEPKEHLVSATPEQFKMEIENLIAEYEKSWEKHVEPTEVTPELKALLGD